MSKLHKINMNIDTSKVITGWMINKKEQLEGGGFGELKASQYFRMIVMQAISSAHKTGNLSVLRRTQSIAKVIDEAIESDGFLTLKDEDFRYVRSSFDKAEWNNSIEIADSLQPILDALDGAEVVE